MALRVPFLMWLPLALAAALLCDGATAAGEPLSIRRPVFQAPAPAESVLPSPRLLALIVDWLSETIPVPAYYSDPAVEFAPATTIYSLRYKPLLSSGPRLANRSTKTPPVTVAPTNVVAVYVDSREVIYLTEGWDARSPADLSVLVHEIVHHLQKLNATVYPCPQAREGPAYTAQDEWLRMFGLSLEGEFGIDPMTLLVSTGCL